jgi:hypothetical protein
MKPNYDNLVIAFIAFCAVSSVAVLMFDIRGVPLRIWFCAIAIFYILVFLKGYKES